MFVTDGCKQDFSHSRYKRAGNNNSESGDLSSSLPDPSYDRVASRTSSLYAYPNSISSFGSTDFSLSDLGSQQGREDNPMDAESDVGKYVTGVYCVSQSYAISDKS